MGALLNSDLPPEERTAFRLWSEGQSIVGAGSETTANTLGVIQFYLLSNKDVLEKLQAELRDTFPDKNAPITLNVVEKLPYLVCLIV